MSNIHEVNVANENLYLELWQYDAGQVLEFVETTIPDGSHVLFANSETRKAIRKVVASNQVGIPNKFLRATGKLHITIETFNENEETTLYEINGYIKRRQDGEPGTAPDDEPTFIQKIIQALNELKDKVENWFYTKDEVDDKDNFVLGEAKSYADGKTEDLDQAKEDKFTVEGHLSKENAVLATEANKWYPAVYVNDQVSFARDSYPNIQQWDVIFGTNEFWVVRYTGTPRLQVQHHREIKFITGEPLERVPAGQTQYDADGIYFSTNGNIYRCLTKTNIPEYTGYIYTWQTYIDAYTKSEIATILLDYGKALSVSIDPLTYVCTFQLKNGNSVLSTASIDLPLESVVVSGSYDAQTKKIILTLQSGQTVEFSVADLVSGLVSTSDLNTALANYQPKITAQNKLDADLLDDSTSTKKTVTQQEKDAWSGKQDAIGPNNKVSADNIDDTNSTNKFTTQAEKDGWDAKEDPTEIENDTTSTTVSLTLENNAENRYKEELTDLTIILPQTIDDDFISGVVFKSGSTPTTMTYDSSIKWTGEDVNNNVFVPAANKAYDFIIWNNGIYINAIVRGVA